MAILGYIGALLSGVSLGLIGGGGSILIVPVLVYLFQKSPILATAYSLFVVGTASLVGAIQYARRGLVDYRTAVIFALPAFVGVWSSRSYIIPALPDVVFKTGNFVFTNNMLIMTVFAVVMLLASVSMIRKKNAPEHEEEAAPITYNYPMIALEGLSVGALTGFVGAGGGFLIIPALVLFAKLPMKLAIGTSLLIISANSLIGFLGDLTRGQAVSWEFLLGLTAIAVLGIFLGSYLSNFIPGKKLRPAFGWFVFVMGCYIFVSQALA